MRTVKCDLCGPSETIYHFMLLDQRFRTGAQFFRPVERRRCRLIYLAHDRRLRSRASPGRNLVEPREQGSGLG